MKENMKEKQRRGMIRDYILLGVTLIIAATILLIFPDRLGSVTTASRDYLTEMMMILPAVMLIMGLFAIWVSKEIFRCGLFPLINLSLFAIWVSKEMVIKYLGKTSGIKGVSLAILFGALPTGPLYYQCRFVISHSYWPVLRYQASSVTKHWGVGAPGKRGKWKGESRAPTLQGWEASSLNQYMWLFLWLLP